MHQALLRGAWVLFFFSGLTGLIYEILWTRRLTLIFGHSILAVSTVITAYMGGLALGSWLGGRLTDRKVQLQTTGSWFVNCYGALEFFIGLWGLLSLPLLSLVERLYFYLCMQGISGMTLSLITFSLTLLTLLPPTIAMGATLPIVSGLFACERDEIGNQLSRLYSINTWGAVSGAGLAGFILLQWLGLRTSIILTACLNFAIGLIAWRVKSERTSSPFPVPPKPLHQGKNLWLPVVFALSGFSSMVFQLGWTRGLTLSLGGAVYSFSAILVVFLIGIAGGSALYPKLFQKRNPKPLHLTWLFLLLAGSASISMIFIGFLPLLFSALLPHFSNNYTLVILLNLGICAIILLPPTLLMGLSFPLITYMYHNQCGRLGRSIGNIYGANTLGCILGSFSSGFFGLPLLGIQTCLQLAISLNLIAALICYIQGQRRPSLMAGGLILTGLVWFMPRWHTGLLTAGAAIYNRSPSALLKHAPPIFYKDGLTCSVALEFCQPDAPALSVNGKIDASMSLNDRINMTLTGLLPLLYLEKIDRAGVIGLGSGTALATLAGSPRVKRVECAELEQAVIDCVPYWSPYLDYFDRNPKIKILEADGRTFILGSAQKFDLLLSEPSNPWIAGIGNLYTYEFYQACHARLNDGGIFLQWCNLYALSPDDLKMVLRTFFSIFPEGEIWLGGGDLMLIGSTRKLECKLEHLREYWEKHPTLKFTMAELGFLQPEEILGQFICNWQTAKADVGPGPRNSDDKPLLEYSAPRSLYRPVVEINARWVLDLQHRANALPASLTSSPERTLQMRLGNSACVFRKWNTISIDPDLPPDYAELFRGFNQAQHADEIPGVNNPLWQKYPHFYRGRLEWARRALEAGYTNKVLELLPQKMSKYLAPQEYYLFEQLTAEAHSQLGQWQEASQAYLGQYQLRPDCISASKLSHCFKSLQDTIAADKWSKKALELNPYDSRAFFIQGWLSFKRQNLTEAEKLIRRSLQICPYLIDAWIELANLFAQSNQSQAVIWAIDQAERYSPDQVVAERFRKLRDSIKL